MTNTLSKASMAIDSTDRTPGRLSPDPGDTMNRTLSLNHTNGLDNGTAINGTLNANKTPAESFYGRTLPREVVTYLVIYALQYRWFIWLERLLPARPRYRNVPYEREEKVEESEDREEEVVKKWVAQGRVHRASLNWCNTFLKWLLELTVGRLWCLTVEYVIRVLLKFESPKVVLKGLKSVSHPSASPLAPGLTMKQASHLQLHRRIPLRHPSCLFICIHHYPCAQANRLHGWCRAGYDNLLYDRCPRLR